MAVFTIEFRDVLAMDPSIETDILAGYPIFDESHRAELNRKIVNHFWNREIGQETVSLFRLQLRRRLDERHGATPAKADLLAVGKPPGAPDRRDPTPASDALDWVRGS